MTTKFEGGGTRQGRGRETHVQLVLGRTMALVGFVVELIGLDCFCICFEASLQDGEAQGWGDGG